MFVTGLQASTVKWTSVYPGTAGQYNNYLSSTSGQTSVTVTPAVGSPDYIDYRVYGNTSSCGTSRDDTIRVYTKPALSIPITPANPAICAGASVTLTASPSGGNPPYTYSWSTGSVLSTTNISVAGTYSLTVSDNTSGCAPVTTTATVVAAPTPAAPAASGTSICAGQTATLTATSPGGTYQWYDTQSGGNLLYTGASFTTPALNSNTTYFVQTTLSGCPGPRTAVTVTVNPIPAAPTVTNAAICAGSTATLTASGSASSYQWYMSATDSISFLTANSYTTPVLNSTTSYYVETTVSGCSSSRTQATVTVNPIPAAPSVANVSVCSGGTATLTATAPGGTYQWYTAASGGTQVGNTNPFTTPVLTASTTYYAASTIAGCTGQRAAVNITVITLPVAPAVNAAGICTGSAATLTVSNPAGGYTYQWFSTASGGQQLATGNSYTTPILNNNASYYVQSMVSGCGSPSSRTKADVTVSSIPAAPTVTNAAICAGSMATLTASGSTSSYQWHMSATDSTSFLSANSYTTPVLNSTTSYYVETTVAGCTSGRTKTTVTVNPIPAAPAAAAVSICSGSSATLQATAPGGVYDWYATAVGGASLQTGASYTTAALTGNTNYYVQTTVAGCTSSRTNVAITVNAIPPAPVINTVTICSGTTAGLSVNAPAVLYTYEWYDAATAGNLVSSGPGYTTPLLTGNANYYVQTVSGGCTSSRTLAAVNVTALPAAPTVAPAYICEGGSTTLSATAPGGTYQWYDAASGGNLLGTGSGFNTAPLTTSTQFYVQTTLAGCTGNRAAVAVAVNPLPAAPTVMNTSICAGNNTSLTATAPGGTYQWYDAASGGNLLLTGATYITTKLNSTTTYYVQTTVAGCTGSRTAAVVTVLPAPAAPTAAAATICAGTASTLVATAPGGAYEWYDAASGGNLLATGQAYITGLLSSSSIFYVQSTSGGCTGPRAAVPVTVNPIPAAPVATGNNSICAGNNITLQANGSGSIQWYDTPAAGNLLTTGSSYMTPVLNQNTSYYVQTTISGCTSSRAVITANVLPIVQPAFTYSTGTYCISGANPTPSVAGGLSGVFSASPAGLSFVSTNTGQINVAASTLGTYAVTLTVAGTCTYTSTVLVTITNAPNATFVYNSPYCTQQVNARPSFTGGASAGVFSSTSSGLVFLNNSTGEIDLKKSTPGTYTVANTITAAGGCAATSASNTVSILPAAVAGAGTGQTVCANTSIQLNGSIGGSASKATWSGGSGSFADAGALSTTYNPAANESVVKLYLTTDDPAGPCTAVTDSVTIYINPLPAKPVVSLAQVCTGTGGTLVAISPGGAYQWYDAATGGSLLGSGSSFTTPVLTASTAYYVQTSLNGCTSARSKAMVTVSEKPAVTSAASGDICAATSFTYLLKSTQAGTNYSWSRPAITGISNPAATGITDSTITEVLNNTTTTGIPVVYSIIPSNNGCLGDPFFYTATVKPTPAAPAINNNSPVCAGSSLNLSTATINNASYQWNGPNGFSSAIQNPVIPNISTAAAGLYRLTIILNNCSSPPSTKNIAPVIAAPTLGSNSPVCEWGKLLLTAAGQPGATYSWRGPAGFSSVLQNPSITGVRVIQAGTYYVTASMAGCTGLTDSVPVSVNRAPVQPAVTSNSPVCSSDSILLRTLNAINNYTFTWSGPNGFKSAEASPLIPNAEKQNAGVYNVTVSAAGCAFTSASSLAVVVNLKPAFSTISNNGPLCEGDSLVLQAGSSPGASYTWRNANGFLSTQQHTILHNISKTSQGTYFVTAVLNGCYSDTGYTQVKIRTAAVAKVTALDAVCANNASTGISGSITGEDTKTGRWQTSGSGSFLPSADSLRAVYIPSAADTATGRIMLTLHTTNNQVCAVSTDSTRLLITPAPLVNAGTDYFVCANDSLIQLQGTVIHAGGGAWSSNGTGFFRAGGSSLNKIYVPSARDIQKGQLQFYLVSTSNANCIAAMDTVQYRILQPPFADAGNNMIIFENETVRLSPTVRGDSLSYAWIPAANLSSDTTPSPLLTGKQNQTYTLRVAGVGGCFVSDTVFVRVLKPIGIPNIFSPNGDGIYDTWVIPELYNYPGAIVEVFSRNGMKVFSSAGYATPWDGTYNGKPLPVATYYYIIKPNFRNLTFSGSVTIVR